MDRNAKQGSVALRLARVLRGVGTSSEGLSSFFKLLVSASLGLGAYYLGCYIISNNISLPISLSTAATLLVALGVTAVIVVGFALLYTTIALFVTSRLLGEIYILGTWTTSRGIINPSRRQQLAWLLLTLSIPQFIGCLLLQKHFGSSQTPWTTLDTCIVVAIYVAIPILFGFDKARVIRDRNNRGRGSGAIRVVKLCLGIAWGAFIVNFVASCSIFLFIAILGLGGLVRSDEDFWTAALFFLAIVTTIFFVRLEPTFVSSPIRRSLGGKILLPEKAFSSSGGYAIVFFVVVSLFPPIASGVGRSALALLGLGGGLPRVIYAPQAGSDSLPQPVIDSCDDQSKLCKSKVVSLLLNAGSTTIFQLKVSGEDQIFSVNTEHASMAWPVTRHPKRHRSER